MNLLLTPRRRNVLACMLFGLGGCSALPQAPQHPPTPPVPAHWQADTASVTADPVSSPESPWWRALDDRQLNALQAAAQKTNVDGLRKALAWRSALTVASLTALNQQPSASLSVIAGASRALESGGTSVVVGGVSIPVSEAAGTTQSYGINAGLAYEWDLWSKLAQATRADVAEAGIRYEDVRSARWLVSTKVAEAYWSIAAIDAKLPLLDQLAQAVDEALRIVHLRLKEGKLRVDEVNVIVAKQYEVRKRIANAQADRGLRLNELAVLLDREAPPLAAGAAILPAGLPAAPDLGTPAQTLERRPDVRQARLAVDAALARLYVTEAARYPSLNMRLNLASNGRHWQDWFSQPLASLGLSLAVPLVDWRRLDAQRDIARDTLDDAALALRSSVRQSLVDVENALLERTRLQMGWEAGQMQQAEKDKVLSVARVRQQVGVFGALDMLQSREGVLMAQLDLIDLRLQAWLNLLALYKALGGAV